MSDLSTIILQLIEIGSKISKSKYVNALNQQDQIRKSIENEIKNVPSSNTICVLPEGPQTIPYIKGKNNFI